MVQTAEDMANMADETIVCKTCHRSFVFSAREKEVHQRKGYKNKPKRCNACRQKPGRMSDSETMREVCKAVGELRVYAEEQFREMTSRLDRIESSMEGHHEQEEEDRQQA